MKYLPAILMLIGGCLLLVPTGDTDVAFSDTLSVAYQADRTAKVENLRRLAQMTGSTAEARSKAWTEMDMKSFGVAFDKVGDDVSEAILKNKEADLAKAWSK
jgi:hypothetical protein